MTPGHRTERDPLRDREVPADAYWGIRTLRACENFPTTGTPISAYPHLVDALAAVKEAAARANEELGLLAPEKAQAIVAACREIRNGHLHGQFVVDVIQGRAGTSANTNANEVIANRALEILGHAKGDYESLHPTEDVNLSHSAADAYPTAIKVATINAVSELLAAMSVLCEAFTAKAEEFRDVPKTGRTQPQDAEPTTLGQEFSAYAVMLEENRSLLAEAVSPVHEINLGYTDIGTGLKAPTRYAEAARRHLADITRLPALTTGNLVAATQDCAVFGRLPGVLKRIAVTLSESCGDLCLISSGPRAELNEFNLPAIQAGSSIMPGEVDEVTPDVVGQVGFEVIGNDATIAMAAEAGQLQLDVFEPVIFHSLSETITRHRAACLMLAERCAAGISVGTGAMGAAVEHSIGLVTAVNPHTGSTAATDIAP
ncbi:aspartate ammonia-lyase [Streptomyces sp. NPDC019443]|uniref:aspartate ammonia-lyase n=1 Tax=Streptomyces sp. NPDC019443 TaxID=3365061 RepID=UPI0037A61675